ncbi:MAG: class I SAM-dependent methyltransferase [Candidatus Nanopelagicales bacterium]|nr:class I SAM-dependent methyltransferase [Candidatus Nanopelagicales bacterium]MDZ4250159.1 class I SAM-dependent methyltransferase [Candidatus Nanopelagicales bacterium]
MSSQVSDSRPVGAGGRVDEDEFRRAWRDPKLANVLYHDWEAASYDDKWGISYDERCIEYARRRFEQVAGRMDLPFARSLEIGAGTGFFTLNLISAGIIDRAVVTDLSPGMVDVALRNGRALGMRLDGRVADAEALPFDDDSFDLVCGHAVLHHIPDLDSALREVLRVLRPGGRFVFTGEPTQRGGYLAQRLSRATWSATKLLDRVPAWRNRYGRAPAEVAAFEWESALEAAVDVHTFDPGELVDLCVRCGAVDVDTSPSEFTASWFGWPVRTFETAVRPESLGWRWYQFAYLGWGSLNWIDERLWTRVVPSALFYNVSVAGAKFGG